MSGGPAVLLYLLLLILPIAALMARRVPGRTVVTMAAIWVVIFGAGAMIVHLAS